MQVSPFWPLYCNLRSCSRFLFFIPGEWQTFTVRQASTHTQGIGFILRLLLFAGVMAGLGQFILRNYIAPEYYRDIMEQMFFAMHLPGEQFDIMLRIMRNPISMILVGIVNTLLYGGFLGLFIAVFTKRPPDPFGGEAPEQNNGDQNA